MSLAGVLDVLAEDPAVRAALEAARSGSSPLHLDLTAPSPLRAFIIAAVAAKAGRPVLAVTATGRESEDLVHALSSLLDPNEVAEFPAWETLPHERLSPRADTVGRRLAVLRRLRHPNIGPDDDPSTGPLKVVVAPVRSVLQPQVPGLGDLVPVELRPGDTAELDDVVHALVEAAYHRVDLVEKRGEIAVRGGILDVFPPTEEHPLRVEFWGDTIEEIRYFKVADQRSLEIAENGLWAPPCRELLLTPEVRARAKALISDFPGLTDMLDRISEGIPVEGMEALAPVLVDEMTLLLDELQAGAHVVVCDPERVRTRAAELVRTSQEFLEASWSSAAVGGAVPIDLGAAAYKTLAEIRSDAENLGIPWWSVTPFSPDELTEEADTRVVGARETEPYRGDTEKALTDVRGWLVQGWRVVVVTEGHGPAERWVEVLKGHDIGVRLAASL
ncbi:MAG: hypothetical protein QOE24_2680, partial [Frankiales bacterium]|nr:hypothetical protein [Frankiales bacterium]